MKEEYIEILVEERSMEYFLNTLLPNILPEGYKLNENCFIRSHQGKSDLMKSIRNKAKAYKRFPWPVKMIVIHDQDSNDCKKLKQKIITSIREHNVDIPLLVRIACKELENWYLGDLEAIEKLYPDSKATKYILKAKYRNPDLLNGSDEMEMLSDSFTKTSCAKDIFKFMDINRNKSDSFRNLITGFDKFLKKAT